MFENQMEAGRSCTPWRDAPTLNALLLLDGPMSSQPDQVAIGGIHIHEFPFCSLSAHLLRAEYLRGPPAVNLRVTVGKGHSAGAAVIAGRNVGNHISHHVDSKLTIVDAVIALIGENQRFARAH